MASLSLPRTGRLFDFPHLTGRYSGRVALHVVSRMTVAEVFERYRIEGPIDEAADREAWQEIAARDAIGE